MSDHNNTEPPAYDDINTSAVILTGAIAALVVLDQRNQAGPTSMPSYQQIEDQKSLLVGGGDTTSIDDAMKTVISKYGK